MLAPTVTALSLLSMDPSPAVVASAESAAGTRHGLVNLTRLVLSLEKRRSTSNASSSWLEVQKDWEMVLYARALLIALRNANEGSSTSAATLGDLERKLGNVEVQVQALAKRTRAPAPTTSLPQFELSAADLKSPAPAALLDEDIPEALLTLDTTEDALPAGLEMPASSVPPATAARRSPTPGPAVLSPPPILSPAVTTSMSDFNTSGYFTKRSREDSEGGEAGLLPLKVAKKNKDGEEVLDQEGMRQRLLGGSRGAMGASQLHEEIGGQLVDMSKQLKKNAMHFSNSLEEEKVLLQSSQDVLEGNLQSTKDSKGQLSKVSSTRRGTTCMTLGIIGLVIVLFVWTFLLIRFAP